MFSWYSVIRSGSDAVVHRRLSVFQLISTTPHLSVFVRLWNFGTTNCGSCLQNLHLWGARRWKRIGFTLTNRRCESTNQQPDNMVLSTASTFQFAAVETTSRSLQSLRFCCGFLLYSYTQWICTALLNPICVVNMSLYVNKSIIFSSKCSTEFFGTEWEAGCGLQKFVQECPVSLFLAISFFMELLRLGNGSYKHAETLYCWKQKVRRIILFLLSCSQCRTRCWADVCS